MGIRRYEFRWWEKYKILNLICLIRPEWPKFFKELTLNFSEYKIDNLPCLIENLIQSINNSEKNIEILCFYWFSHDFSTKIVA